MRIKLDIELTQKERNQLMLALNIEIRKTLANAFKKNIQSIDKTIFIKLMSKAMSKAFNEIILDHFDYYIEQNREKIFQKALKKSRING